ncbi:hypothetical protein Z969_06375 [Clostridium novyi A str. 4570]|uniref:Prepilin-type N-terminal cleavage/methylation domain-containing protein n=1 Tax=Clostridium novyi A str. 4570 TaxID=1444290 RepID=A0AA88ZN56_CLONO|nr:hypothetical protein Z969_06375 [Clostridium novyi A str. 4570]
MGGVLNGKYPGKTKKKKGFTLIELIIVIAILGILALIAIPKFGSAQKDAKIKADIATGKTIADTTAALIAKGDITGDQKDIALTKPEDKPTEDSKKIQKLIIDNMGSGQPKAQAIKDGIFYVTVDKDGNVKVYVGKDGTNQVYPEHTGVYEKK